MMMFKVDLKKWRRDSVRVKEEESGSGGGIRLFIRKNVQVIVQ